MSLLDNSIGDFEFLSLSGLIMPPEKQCVIDDRPAVDGSEKILTGTKGPQFRLISQVDAENYEAARDALSEYRALIEADAQAIVQGGIKGDDKGYRVTVVKVNPLDIRPIVGFCGNYKHPPSQGFIAAEWILVCVPYTVPTP